MHGLEIGCIYVGLGYSLSAARVFVKAVTIATKARDSNFFLDSLTHLHQHKGNWFGCDTAS